MKLIVTVQILVYDWLVNVTERFLHSLVNRIRQTDN